MGLYRTTLRPLLFRLDAERAHHLAIGTASHLGWAAPLLRPLTALDDPRLGCDLAGLHFPNPIGLAAGFDKSGAALPFLASLGFGSVETGSISHLAAAGNPKPRLFRLPQDRAIVVAYGVPNDGAEIVSQRLAGLKLPVPLGVNLVKTNLGRNAPPETAEAIIADYVAAARILAPRADYLMLNLSCPNTVDGRDFFSDRVHLDACLIALRELDLKCPVFLKVSPLGGISTIERLLEAAAPHGFIRGFMFNLPSGKPDTLTSPPEIWRDLPGAVSGPPSAKLADFCIAETYRRMDRHRYALIGAGGVSTAQEAYAKLRLGCSLVQLLTALIYEGPLAVQKITRGLVRLLDRDGVRHVSEAIGTDVR